MQGGLQGFSLALTFSAEFLKDLYVQCNLLLHQNLPISVCVEPGGVFLVRQQRWVKTCLPVLAGVCNCVGPAGFCTEGAKSVLVNHSGSCSVATGWVTSVWSCILIEKC